MRVRTPHQAMHLRQRADYLRGRARDSATGAFEVISASLESTETGPGTGDREVSLTSASQVQSRRSRARVANSNASVTCPHVRERAANRPTKQDIRSRGRESFSARCADVPAWPAVVAKRNRGSRSTAIVHLQQDLETPLLPARASQPLAMGSETAVEAAHRLRVRRIRRRQAAARRVVVHAASRSPTSVDYCSAS